MPSVKISNLAKNRMAERGRRDWTPGWFQRDRSHDGLFVTNQGIVLPSVMPRQPLDEAEEEDQEEDDASQPWITARLKLHQLPKNL